MFSIIILTRFLHIRDKIYDQYGYFRIGARKMILCNRSTIFRIFLSERTCKWNLQKLKLRT